MNAESKNLEIFSNPNESFNGYIKQAHEVINKLDDLDINRKQYANKAVNEAIEIIRKNFEGHDNPVENLDYHNSRHTITVVIRTIEILRAMQRGGTAIESKHFLEAIIAAAFHDTVQDYKVIEIEENGFKKKMRVRATGENERKSSELAEEFMKRVNSQTGTVIFDEDSIRRVKEAIVATEPGFDHEKKIVYQPNLKNNSHPVTRALALADLGTAGMGDYEEFKRDGDALFREENIDILEALKAQPDPLRRISYEKKKRYRERMIAWSESQVSFAEGRMARFEIEIEGLPDDVKQELRQLFANFGNTIAGARTTSLTRQNMTFEDLARDMGYRFKHNNDNKDNK